MSNNKNGYELELKFYEWLLSKTDHWVNGVRVPYDNRPDLGIINLWWLSQESKSSEFDFLVKSNGLCAYFDVVGHYQFRDSYRLNTSNKSWKIKLDWLKNYGNCSYFRDTVGYLAFSFDDGIHWRFYKIHNKLPKGDLLLTKEREKNILTAGWLFGIHGNDMKELRGDALLIAKDIAEQEGITNKDKFKALVIELENEFIEENKI